MWDVKPWRRGAVAAKLRPSSRGCQTEVIKPWRSLSWLPSRGRQAVTVLAWPSSCGRRSVTLEPCSSSCGCRAVGRRVVGAWSCSIQAVLTELRLSSRASGDPRHSGRGRNFVTVGLWPSSRAGVEPRNSGRGVKLWPSSCDRRAMAVEPSSCGAVTFRPWPSIYGCQVMAVEM